MLFGCILETRVKENKAGRILNKVFRGWSSITNYECSQGGRIWLLWRDDVRITTVYKTDQFITCSVGLKDQEEFFYTCVYANNLSEDRKELWGDCVIIMILLFFRIKRGLLLVILMRF